MSSLSCMTALLVLGIGVSAPATAQVYDIEILSNQSSTFPLVKPGSTVLIGPGVTLAPASGDAITAAAGDVWDITNQGRIQVSNGYAAQLFGNGSRFTNRGLITGASGIVSSGALTLINDPDARIEVMGNGVVAAMTEGPFVLNNAGLLISTDAMAVNASIANAGSLGASMTNSGLIQSRQTALNIWTGATGTAPVYVMNLTGGQIRSDDYAVSVTHSTSLVTNQAGAVISGSTGGVVGVDLYTVLHVDNAGSILSDAGAGIRSYGGGSVVNAAGAHIEGLGGVVYVRPVAQNIPNQVDNSGSIKGTGTVFVSDNLLPTTGSGTGVYLGGGAPGITNQVINRQGATIEGALYGVFSGYGPRFSDAVGLVIDNAGSISGQTGIALNAGQGTIVNSGVITGTEGIAIQFDQEGEYENHVTLDTGSQLHGSVLGGSGHDSLVLAGEGTESLDRFVRFETLSMQGENWHLTGNGGFSVQTDITRGVLQLEGVLASPVIHIQEAGVLTGTGTLVGNIINQGLIAPGQRSNFAMLTIQGNYIGDGGSVLLKTRLAADDSRSDKLVITGDAQGDTSLQIINQDGSGALTQADGIQVVQIGGASEATFTLQSRVVAGAFEYKLFKNAVNTEDGNWYLRSAKDPVIIDPPVVVPPPGNTEDPDTPAPTPTQPTQPPVQPTQPSVPLWRPEVGAYMANQFAARGLFVHALQDRLGESKPIGRAGQNAEAVWVRVQGGRMESQAAQGEIDEKIDSTVVQMGGDLGVWKNADSRLQVGAMAGYGSAQTRARAQDNEARATGEIDGYSLGLYGTWYQHAAQKTGPYVDTWLQYAWFDNTVQGNGLSGERYHSSNLSVSLETGWAFILAERINSQMLIEPQVQAIYSHYTQDEHSEVNGTRIHNPRAGQLLTRLGVRLYGRIQTAAGRLWQPFVGVNAWHGSSRDRITFDEVTVQQEVPKNRYEVKAGLQAELAKNWRIQGAVAVQRGQHQYSDVHGSLGIQYVW